MRFRQFRENGRTRGDKRASHKRTSSLSAFRKFSSKRSAPIPYSSASSPPPPLESSFLLASSFSFWLMRELTSRARESRNLLGRMRAWTFAFTCEGSPMLVFATGRQCRTETRAWMLFHNADMSNWSLKIGRVVEQSATRRRNWLYHFVSFRFIAIFCSKVSIIRSRDYRYWNRPSAKV
jgi:hypothetical protein